METAVTLIVFLPLIAALIAGFGPRQIGDFGAQFVTCTSVIVSAFLSAKLFAAVNFGGEPFTVTLAPWIVSGDFALNWALKIDSLTSVMFVVVTWVSSVVHVYSMGYMEHDPAKGRFMSYLSLFTFAMLMLVSADNLIQMFFGWEGVGVASYLLIGFWNDRDSANKASMKAFLVNRVGDFGFALGIMTVFLLFGTVTFSEIFTIVEPMSRVHIMFLGYQVHAVTLACLLLFMGAMGKSAQLGLHTWLPDAMEGPTPVSALIHAATMVTAGVFMVARLSPLFEYSPMALEVVTVVGALTAFLAATIALTQNDIKRVIAYSTMSQLGYMFFALGVSAYGAAMFHLFTHAFFKALLFLGAGSVIHALHDEQDMRNMGGLRKKTPLTYVFMWIGSLALAGLPFFSGFYSKDIILEAAFASGSTVGQIAFWMGIAAAFLTAFYSWRLLIMTFHGESRSAPEVFAKAHESPWIMNGPLFVLVAGALFAGYLGYEHFVGHEYDVFWNGSLLMLGDNVLEAAHHVPMWVIAAPMVVGVVAITLAYVMYQWTKGIPDTLMNRFKPLYNLSHRKWYFDELYDLIFVRFSLALGNILWQIGDRLTIDGLGPDGFATMSRNIARRFSALQNGYIYRYAITMLLGVVLILGYFIFFYKGASIG